MDSVGELLRSERLRQGLDLTRIAERTRINESFLEAIERGDTESLPGAFFYRAFVRQYAQSLGLRESDLEPMLSELRLRAEAEQPLPSPPAAAQIEVPPIPVASSARRFTGPRPSSIVLLVAVILGCSGIYALWQRTQRASPAAVHRPPTQTQAASPPQPEAAPAPSPAAPPPAEQAAAPPQPDLPAVEPAISGAKLNIEVEASEPVWYSATTESGKTSSTLKAGQSRRFASNERAIFFVGNAGGIDIRVNGKSLGPIGPRGHLKTVVITPEGASISNPREKKEGPGTPP
jgi:cytoskeletal protein RodZ